MNNTSTTHFTNKYILGQNIHKLYSIIKSNKIIEFKEIIEKNPELLLFKNTNNENLLFYAFLQKSNDIIKYINDLKPDFINEKNKKNISIFEKLIIRNKPDILENYFSIIQDDLLKNEIKNNPSLLELAINNLSHSSWDIFFLNLKHIFPKESYSYINKSGNSLLHLIAKSNRSYFLDIIPHIDKSLFNTKDNDFGDTPFLSACKKSSLKIYNSYLTHSNINELSFFGNNSLHYASINEDSTIIKSILLNNGISNPNAKNLYNDSPLMNCIVYKNEDNFSILLDKYADINEELAFSLINSTKIFNLNFLYSLTDIQISNLSIQNRTDILNYCFKKYSFDEFNNISEKFNLINNINPDNISTLYKSTLIGKKDMDKKVNLLLPFIYKDDNLKSKTLSILPSNQILFLLNNTNLLSKFNDLDYLYLYAIGNSKNSLNVLKYINIDINENNFSFDNYINSIFSKSKKTQGFINIINNIKEVDSTFYDKLSINVILSNDKALIYSTLKKILSKEDKKKFIFSLTHNIMINKENNENYFNIFYNKNLIKNYLKENFDYDSYANPKFFNHLINFLSDNEKIDILINLISHKNTLYNTVDSSFINNLSLQDINFNNLKLNNWKILNYYFKDTIFYDSLLKSYTDNLLNNTNLISEFNYYYNDSNIMLISNDNIEKIIKDNLSYILNSDLKYLFEFKYKEISNSLFLTYFNENNYNNCILLHQKKLIDINTLNLNFDKGKDINSYFTFLQKISNDLSIKQINQILTNFHNNINTYKLDYEESYYINKYLHIFNDRIEDIDNNLLIKICNHVILKNDYNDESLFSIDLNSILNTVLNDKKTDKLTDLHKKEIINHKLINNENKSIINYNNIFNDINMQNIKQPKRIKI